MAKTNNNGAGTAVALTAAAVAAAAGAYWLYGAKNAAKNRQMVKSWMLKARAEVMEAVEKLSEVDKAAYLRIVDEVLARYSSLAGVTSAELARVARDLKESWEHVNKAQRSASRPVRRAKRIKKAAKSRRSS
jgi:hypothetical protein